MFQKKNNHKKLSPPASSFLGLLAMVGFYYLILSLTTQDYWHPYYFFLQKWYLLAPIFIGFATQVFLLQKLKMIILNMHNRFTGASAGTNAVAMIACCAHHLADIFPVLGFMGIASFASDYQDYFLLAGAIINWGAVIYFAYRLKQLRQMPCCNTHN